MTATKSLSLKSYQIEQHLEAWRSLTSKQRISAFEALPRNDAEDIFLNASTRLQYELIRLRPDVEKRSWIRLLEPDDAADLIQKFPASKRNAIAALLDLDTQKDVLALMAYAEDKAGGLMNSRFIRLRPDTEVDVAIRYLRAQTKSPSGVVHYIYVLDSEQHLLGVVSFRELLLSSPNALISAIMNSDVISLPEDMSQEEVSRKFAQHHYSSLPVVDKAGRIKGVVTVDDVVQVVQETATEDIQKLGGSEALDEPYLQISFGKMIKKRAGWLTVLFLGEMLTATAMGYFQKEIEKAVVLALFIPLIISSGGNSGSQATSLIIRALALGEVRIKDWWKVFVKEVASGLTLGLILGAIGLARILLWPTRLQTYGTHFFLVGLTVALSLVGVVMWGSLAGSMLPFVLRRAGFDPAVASAPFVATLVDVTGLIIYFSVASIVLGGVLL
jgi:magnesium transporter